MGVPLHRPQKHLSGTTNRELTAPLELRCDVSMLKRLWRRIVERHRRNIAELDQIEMELAKAEAHLPALPPFPQKPYKASTIVLYRLRVFRRIRGLGLLQRTRDSILPLMEPSTVNHFSDFELTRQ